MTPEKPDRDLDKEFEDLIANWDTENGDTEKGDTGNGDTALPTNSPEQPDAAQPSSPPAAPTSPPQGVNIWRGPTIWRPAEDAFASGPAGPLPDGNHNDDDDHQDDDEEGFEPQPVHLPPQEDLHFWGIVVGLVGGGLLLLYVAATGVSRSSWWFLAAIGLFVGGFALLILRQPHERDTSDDGTRL